MSKDVGSGTRRAVDFNDALATVPGFADDSMFFVMRYYDKVKNSLCQADFDDFISNITALSAHYAKHNGPGKPVLTAEEADVYRAKSAKLKEAAVERLHEYPDLVRDFDRFLANSRAARAAMGA